MNKRKAIAIYLVSIVCMILFLLVFVIISINKFKKENAQIVNVEDVSNGDTEIVKETNFTPDEDTNNSLVEDTKEEDENYTYEPEYIDADKYYEEIGDILQIVNAKEFKQIQTEKQALDFFKDRGFGEYSVLTDYSIDGEFLNEQEVTGTDALHPDYYIYYLSPNEELWTVSTINGSITAYPVSFIFQSNLYAPLIITESEVFTGYDGPTNRFFEVKPYDSALITYVVDKIDAQTLDNLTIDVLNNIDF